MGKDSSINLTPGRVRMTGSGGKREKLSAWIWCVCFLGASLLLVFWIVSMMALEVEQPQLLAAVLCLDAWYMVVFLSGKLIKVLVPVSAGIIAGFLFWQRDALRRGLTVIVNLYSRYIQDHYAQGPGFLASEEGPVSLLPALVAISAVLLFFLGYSILRRRRAGMLFFLMIVLLCAGLLVLGKVFALTTVISSFYYPFILAVLQGALGEVRLTEDPLLATVLAGVMIGAGIGIVIRAGASTGGMDIPPLVLQKKLRIPVSVSLYVFDCLILLLQALFSNVEQVLYGLVMVLLYTLTLNKTLLLGTGQMQLKVVSKKYGEISQAIQRQVDRGTTLFQSMGGFEQEQGCTVLTVVDRRELPKLTELVTEIDPDAFMVVNQVNEVRGRGFTSPKRYEKRDT